jgi:hypothetical protein
MNKIIIHTAGSRTSSFFSILASDIENNKRKHSNIAKDFLPYY